MSESKPRMTVGIPTFGRDGVLTDTVARLLKVVDPATAEIIVADQTPQHDEATTGQLQDWDRAGRIRWIACHPPSLTAARNAILREMKSDVVLFLDDDVIVPSDLLDRHRDCYERDATIAAVAGEVFHCHDPAMPASLDAPTRGASAHFANRCLPGPIMEMVGAHHSVKKSAAIAVGGYDEALIGPAYCEDSDMALRLSLAGHRVEYEPRAWLIHIRSPSGGCRIPGTTTHPEWTKSVNFLTFSLRHWWNHWGARRAFWTALRAGPLRRENVRNPLRWPSAWWNWGKAMTHAIRHRRFVPDTSLGADAAAAR